MSMELNSVNTKHKIEVDAEKRAFMKKAGKYAVVGAGMATLMTPTLSTAGNYGHCKPPHHGGGGHWKPPHHGGGWHWKPFK